LSKYIEIWEGGQYNLRSKTSTYKKLNNNFFWEELYIMNNVKSWKKNFKKTGALALATLVMCGSASFVRAEGEEVEQPQTITLNEEGSGAGGQTNVLGYQTDASSGYAASITWGDMIFVYDNGTYDPETGRLIATDTLSDVQPDALKETVTSENIKCSANGYDLYVDKSTGNEYELVPLYLKLDADVNVTEEYVDYFDIVSEIEGCSSTGRTKEYEGQNYDILGCHYRDEDSCYVIETGTTFALSGEFVEEENLPELTPMYEEQTKVVKAGYWYNFDGNNNSVTVTNLSTSDLKFTATPAVNEENAGESVSFSLYSRAETDDLTYNTEYRPTHDEEWDDWYAGTSLTKTLVAPELDPATGEITAMEGKYTFYLNISGKPSGDVILQSEKDNGTDATVLGTITLNFSTSDDTELPIKGNPNTGRPNEEEENGGE